MTSWVKTCRGVECFWCRVEEPFGPNAVICTIDNDLVSETSLKKGQKIVIRHVDVVEVMSLPEKWKDDPFELR